MRTKTNKVLKFGDLSPKKDAHGGRRAHIAGRQGQGNHSDFVPPSNPEFPPHLPF